MAKNSSRQLPKWMNTSANNETDSLLVRLKKNKHQSTLRRVQYVLSPEELMEIANEILAEANVQETDITEDASEHDESLLVDITSEQTKDDFTVNESEKIFNNKLEAGFSSTADILNTILGLSDDSSEASNEDFSGLLTDFNKIAVKPGPSKKFMPKVQENSALDFLNSILFEDNDEVKPKKPKQ